MVEKIEENKKFIALKRQIDLSIAFMLGFNIALVIALIKIGVFQLP